MKIKKVLELKSEDFFQEISISEYEECVSKWRVQMSVFDYVDRKYLNENGIKIYGAGTSEGLTLEYAKKVKINDFPPLKLEIDIFKLEDEWYFISYRSSADSRRFYKCDQFEGLVNCLGKIPHWSLNIKRRNG